jgi:hypothetical protein
MVSLVSLVKRKNMKYEECKRSSANQMTRGELDKRERLDRPDKPDEQWLS